MPRPRLYYKFSDYLKQRFNCRVHKVSVNAGFSCPNRDGRIAKDGCIYCDNRAFSPNARTTPIDIEGQIKKGIDIGRRRFKAEKFIIYFQAYTNTYADPKTLQERYDLVKKFSDIVGIAIGTRPDCINDEILELIAGYAKDYELWLEYGLQSIHDDTLKQINRGHLYQDFLKAVELTRQRKDIKICAHLIIGLPGETRQDILATAKEVGRLKLDGLKIHPLHIIKETKLAELFAQGRYAPIDLDEYVSLVADFLGYLWPDTVIQRLSADCPRQFLIAPLWLLEKNKVLQEIDNALIAQGKFQGQRYTS